MVFSSLPAAYHDPANWQQQPNHPTGTSTNISSSHQLLPPGPAAELPPPPPSHPPHGGGGPGSIRPGSMADRARMANIPMPETALKCPRCESTNTKFCYFNNYSLTQPRHFCKTCRRYWTRGGALRNVPVGGGCRRNKRSSKGTNPSSSSNKSPASSSDRQAGSSTSSGAIPSINTPGGSGADILGLAHHQVPGALRFMAPLHHQLSTHQDFAAASEIALNYGGFNYGSAAADLSFHHMGGAGGSGSSLLSAVGEQWRWQPPPPQFPFLPAGLDPSTGLLGEGISPGFQVRPKVSSSGITHQMASVKMEDHNHNNNNNNSTNNTNELNLSRQLLGNDHYWATNSTTAWTDLSGFSSSSTTSNQL